MNQVDASEPSSTNRLLAWVGLWLCTFGLFTGLMVWIGFFHIPGHSGLPAPGGRHFWPIIGFCAAVSSLLTLQTWIGQRKRANRHANLQFEEMPPRRKLGVVLSAGGFLFIFPVLVALGSGRAAPDWPAVVGGYLVLAAFTWAGVRCGSVAMLPTGADLQAAAEQAVSTPKSIAPWARPPRNSYRGLVTDEQAVYRRPTASRVGMSIVALFIFAMTIMVAYFALGFFGLAPMAVTIRGNPAMGILMIICVAAFSLMAIQTFLTTGSQEIRVRRSEKAYLLRQGAPLPSWLAAVQLDRSTREETGIPWRIVEHSGPCSEIAGIAIRPVTNRSVTVYWVYLIWNRSDIKPMRVGFARKEDAARALQAQAAEDLGLPTLPDEAIMSA